jgi:hypothetical protein
MTTSPLAEGVVDIVEQGGGDLVQALTKFVTILRK